MNITSKVNNDLWGDLCKKHFAGDEIIYSIQRSDGKINKENISFYFRSKLSSEEDEILSKCKGPILDLGCGPGSSLAYFENKNIEALGIDNSKGAISVAKNRTSMNCRVESLDSISKFKNETFSTVLLNGNNLGLCSTVDEFKKLLKQYHRVLKPGGKLIANSIDPLNTTNQQNIDYQKKNIQQSEYVGKIKIRLNYKDEYSPWWDLLLLKPSDVEHELSNLEFSNIKITP